MSEFLIGQRVIYSDKEIVTILEETKKGRFMSDEWSQWVRKANGVEQCVALTNLKPLPNGQL